MPLGSCTLPPSPCPLAPAPCLLPSPAVSRIVSPPTPTPVWMTAGARPAPSAGETTRPSTPSTGRRWPPPAPPPHPPPAGVRAVRPLPGGSLFRPVGHDEQHPAAVGQRLLHVRPPDGAQRASHHGRRLCPPLSGGLLHAHQVPRHSFSSTQSTPHFGQCTPGTYQILNTMYTRGPGIHQLRHTLCSVYCFWRYRSNPS